MADYIERNSDQCKAVAAIDFGTTFTGFAFSLRERQEVIYLSTYGNVFHAVREPTSIILDASGNVLSFGTAAENEYSDYVIQERNKEIRFFRRFKMELYRTETLSRKTTINDTTGKPANAMEIFSKILAYLKQPILESVRVASAGKFSSLDEDENIFWVLTIPAIWSDSARQFMREAATNAGFPKKRLRLVLEPEAASMFCREQRLHLTAKEFTPLPPGSKYILADLGGGTADICVHEVLNDGRIMELHRATGGDFGGTSVDREFESFLIKIVGARHWKTFQENYFDQFLSLMQSFETKKRHFQSNLKPFVIELGPALLEMLQTEELTVEELVNQGSYADLVEVKRGNKLVCNGKIMEDFFRKSVESIIKILKECNYDGLDTVLLVGGFAESPYVRGSIQKELGEHFKIATIQNPSLAVLKGAVMMGYQPMTVIQRKARFTYGISVSRPFVDGLHPESLKYIRDGQIFCSKMFEMVIEKDSILEFGQIFKVDLDTSFKLPDSKRSKSNITVYKTAAGTPPNYCNSNKCTAIGEICKEPPAEGWPDRLQAEIHWIVGETEFYIKVFEKQTGREFTATVDFL